MRTTSLIACSLLCMAATLPVYASADLTAAAPYNNALAVKSNNPTESVPAEQIDQARANAMAIYRQTLSQTPGALENAYVRDWVNKGMTSTNPSRQFVHFAHAMGTSQSGSVNSTIASLPGTIPGITAANAARQSGDYFNEMVSGGTQRWAKSHFPLKVYIAPSGGTGFRPSLPKLFEDAMHEWQTKTSNKLSFVQVADAGSADITVLWIPYSTATECGKTTTKWLPDSAGNQSIIHATVLISTWINGPVSDKELRKICLHEIGHALGLKHSSNRADIMYFQSNYSQVSSLGPRDIATIDKLYSMTSVGAVTSQPTMYPYLMSSGRRH